MEISIPDVSEEMTGQCTTRPITAEVEITFVLETVLTQSRQAAPPSLTASAGGPVRPSVLYRYSGDHTRFYHFRPDRKYTLEVHLIPNSAQRKHHISS